MIDRKIQPLKTTVFLYQTFHRGKAAFQFSGREKATELLPAETVHPSLL